MNRYQTQARLACQISIGLMAGVFSIVPAVQASPVQDAASSYNKGSVTVVPGTVTTVTSKTQNQNNIVAWKDFSVAQGETVQFDGGDKTKNNYLNVVTGNATSQIAGTIEGGKNVYLVNPHGVIFSKTARVDVGNLYVSTEDAASAVSAYNANSTGGAVLQASTAQADVVNLGKITADNVEVDGTHIRFLNSADVTAKSSVVLNAAGDDAYVHVGNAGGTNAGYTSTKGNDIDYYQLVSNATELQNIKNDLGKNYMLSEDIDASGIVNFTPLGDSTTPFSGKFDGMFYEVQNLNVNTADQYAGLFGVIDGGSTMARVDNLGIVGAKITTSHADGEAGALAGSANHVVATNVYSEKGQNGAVSAALYAGGLFGCFGDEINNVSNTAFLRSSYNTTDVKTASYLGGLAGIAGYGASFIDVYNTSNSVRYGIAQLASKQGQPNASGRPKVTRAYTTTTDFTDDDSVVKDGINAPTTSLKTYTAAGWTDGTDISSDGTKNTTWRIYEGQSTPLLTAFLKGTVTASYRYNYFASPTDQAATTDGLALAGVTGTTDGSDINATYNAQYFKIADSTGQKAGTVSDITFSGGVKAGDNDVVIDSRVSGSGIRNVSDSGAFISSTQHGYNIVGGNLDIAKREVNVTGGTYHITREYDGTDDATSALLSAINSSSSGYQVTGLLANDTVKLSGITATYQGNGANGRAAKDADTGKSVTVNASGIGLKDTKNNGAEKNYKLNTSSLSSFSVTGDITPRTLYLTVKKSGFTKVYDGTKDVVTKNPDAAADKNLTIDTTKGAAHQLVTVNGAQDAIYYDTDKTQVAYDTKDAGQNKTISYENISLKDANAANYRLVAENAQSASGYDVLYDPSSSTAATGKLTTTGSISQRVIDPTTFSVKDAKGAVSKSGTKVYDGETAFDSTGYTLVAPQAAATGDTGIVAGENITFSIVPGKADFEDASGNKTSQVNNATQIGYDIQAVAGKDTKTGGTTLLSNYIWGKDGKTLTAADTYQVTTPGTITKRALKVQVTQPASVSLDKDYDGTPAIVSSAKYDPNGIYGKASTFGAQGYVDYASGSLTLVTDETNQKTPTIAVQAAYDNKNVNRTAAKQTPQARNIDYTVTLSGANADNYTINGQASSVTMTGAQTGAKGVIYPKDLTSSFAPVPKEYDGTTNMPGGWSSGGSLSGVEQGDTVSLASGARAQFQSKDVRGDGTTWTDASGQVWKNWVNYSNLSLTGADALNYDIQSTAQGVGTITPRKLGVGDFDYTFTPLTKEYDGGTVISPADAASHLLTVTVKANKSQAQDVFKGVGVDHTKNVRADYTNANSQKSAPQTVNYTLTILDDGSGNFTLPQDGLAVTAQTQGTITPRKVIATVANANLQKTYDATTAAGAGAGTLISYTHFTRDGQPGLMGNDTDKSTGVYQASAAGKTSGEQDADAGTNKDVLYTLGIHTADPSNYEIVDANGNPIQTLAGKGTIDQCALTVTFGPAKKYYDGTPDVPRDAKHIEAHLDDGKNGQVIGADGTVLDLTKVQGVYRDASGRPVSDVGTGLAVAYSNLVQALGTHAKNYIINGTVGTDTTSGAGTATGTGKIMKLPLTNNNFHFNFQNITKEYDGSQDVAYTDRQGQSHAAASFIDEHYVDLNNNGTYDAGDVLLGGANLSGLKISSAQYADKDAGQGKAVTYKIALGNLGNYDLTKLSGAQSKNATLSYANGVLTAQTTGAITPRKVYASLVQTPTAVRKVYDGGTAIMQGQQPQNIMGDVQLDGLLTRTAHKDGVRLDMSATQAQYADEDAGTNKDILYHILLTGAGASTNYQLLDAQSNALTKNQLVSHGTGTIDKAPLTIGFGRVEKTYDAKADVTTTGSTTNGDITTITPGLSGFVNGETVSFDPSATAKIKGYYTDWDGKTGMPMPDANVNLDSSTRTVKDKAVYYTGIDTAFADLAARNAVLKNYEITKAEPGAQFLSTSTSGVKDTVYFAESLGKGRIKQLSLAQGQIKENWTLPITKEYDTTYKVLEPEKHFELYTDVTGTQISIGYDLASAVYDNNRVDQTNGTQVGVTYTLQGISQQSLGNFIIDAATQQAYQNKQYKTTGEITPKKIRAQLDKTSGILKTYDGTLDADVKNLVFYDAKGNRLSDDGIYAKDRPLVNTAVVAAYGDKTATIDPGAAATDVKTVTYKLTLSDATGKGNYVLDGQFGSPKTASTQQNIYEGKGDIKRRKVFVDFAKGRQPKVPDKTYDGNDTVDVSKIADYPHIFEALPEDAQTGVVTVQGTKDDAEVDDASVQAAYQSRHVVCDASGAPTTQDVYFWNFQLKGKDKDNYIVVANPQSQYARKHGAALAGSGKICPDQVTVWLKDKIVQKEYDGTTAVVNYTDADGTAHNYLTDNLQWNDAPIVGRGDKLVTKWVQAKAPAFASKDVKGTDGQGTNPVTYAFTWSNDSADGTGYHDYDVVIAPQDGQVTGQGAKATAALTATGVITPRVLTVTGAADATKVYDTTPDLVGLNAGKNLTFARKDGSTNVLGQGDTINDLLAQADAKYQETAQGKGDAADATAGVASNGTSLPLLGHKVVYTNITLGNSNYALDPTSLQTVKGKGTITRASIKMKAAPVSITEGSTLPASYRGAETGWQGLDGWLGTDGANVHYAPEDGQTSRAAGSYPIWAWYRTGQDAQGNDIFTKVAQRPYDKNYVLEQDPANATALAIMAPSVNVPADIEQETAMAKKFTPDRRAYNHASHDEMNSVVREPQAGLAYADGGVNAGHVVTSAGGDVSHSMMDVQGQGEVVNLTGGDAAQGAMRDVTRHGKSFTLTGRLAAYGLSEEAASQLQAQAGTSGPEEAATVGIKGGNVNAAEGQPQGNLLGTKGGDSSRGISGSEPAVQQSGGNSAADASPVSPAAGVTLFHDASEGYPGHLAATEDAHLFDDAVPAVTAAGEAHVSLFDDSSEIAGRENSSHGASGAAVSLFGDEPAAQPASGAGISASGAVKAQTSSADEEEDEKEKEEAAHAAALKAKGADIGIESEGAGVNLAG